MENSILVGLSRQMTLHRALDVIANNVANVNTAGYRRDSLIFNDYLMPVARADGFPNRDRTLHYVVDPTTRTDYTTGSIEHTGNALDVALQGDGFFTIQTAQGERYTRDGGFQLNAQGELVTGSGNLVLSDNGPVTFAPNETQISIASDGTISTNIAQHGKLRITSFQDNALLVKEGDNLLAARPGVQGTTPQYVRMQQGSIERSNVQPVIEMARMLEVTRTYSMVSQMIDNTAKLRETAIQQLGNPNA